MRSIDLGQMYSLALYICLSQKWGTKEKRIIKDCKKAHSKNYPASILCYKDSFLDEEAKKHKIHRIYIKPHVESLINIAEYFELKRAFGKHDLRYVHCYGLEGVLWVSFIIRHKRSIPFFVSIFNNYNISGFLWRFLRVFLARVDKFFISSVDLNDLFSEKLKLKKTRFEILGPGISLIEEEMDLSNVFSESVQADGKILVGTSVEGHLTSIDRIIPLLHAIKALKFKGVSDKLANKLKFFLVAEREWSTYIIYADLLKELKRQGLVEDIQFYSVDDMRKIYGSFHLWICTVQTLYLSYDFLEPLCHGVPLLAPRNAMTQEFFRNFDGVGETYLASDPREIRRSLYRVLESHKKIKSKLKAQQPKFLELYGEEAYDKNLKKFYQVSMAKRQRFFHSR